MFGSNLRLTVPLGSSLLLLMVVLVVRAVPPEAADLVLVDGRIATLVREGEFVEAIAIKNGVVLATGSTRRIEAHRGPATHVIDLGGRCVIPGLDDSHSHVVRGGRFYNLELRWDGVATLAEALERVRVQAERTPTGQWVRVIGGWSPYQFAERRMPTIAELNEAAPDVPVFVLFLYSSALVNRAAVDALGIGPNTIPPAGGRYVFRDGGAELVADPSPSILYGTIAQLPHLSSEEQLDSTRRFVRELNRFGITSAVDAGGGGHAFPTDYEAARALAHEGKLPLRIAYYLFPQRPGHELEDVRDWTRAYAAARSSGTDQPDRFDLEGAGELLTWSTVDFENFLAPRPELAAAADEELAAVVRRLVEKRWPFRIHATYGESIERILGVLERVDHDLPFDGLRWAIDHAETIRIEQIERVRRLGGGVAIQNRMAFAGESFRDRYGVEAAGNAPPLRALVESGVPLGAGTDATRVSSHNPWLALHWLVTGETLGGEALLSRENRLTRFEALRAWTSGSAWFSGEENLKGTLEPGRYADLAVLSHDWFTVSERDIPRIESLLTIVAGDIVYGAGPFVKEARPLGSPSPAWSPVALFEGYAAKLAPEVPRR